MKKLIGLFTVFVLAFSLCACSQNAEGENTNGNNLTGELEDIVAKVCENYDFSTATFVYSGSEEASDTLYLIYGIENAEILEDYVLCKRGEGKAATFAAFRFKEATAAETIQDFKDTLQYYYVEGMYKDFKLYNPSEYKIAEGATYKQYDNALVLAIYDTEKNEGIFEITDTFKK